MAASPLPVVKRLIAEYEVRAGLRRDRSPQPKHQSDAIGTLRVYVDVIFAPSSTETERAKQATSTIPIVFSTMPTPSGSDVSQAAAARRKHYGIDGRADRIH